MSLTPRDLVGQMQVVKHSRQHFQLCNWSMEPLKAKQTHYIVEHKKIKFIVSCHDDQMQLFYAPIVLIDAFRKRAREIRNFRHVPTIFVLPSHFPGVMLDKVAESGVHIFTFEELGKVTALSQYLDELPIGLEKRQILLMQDLWPLCSSVINRFQKVGDPESAIAWATRAVRGAERYTKAHDILFSLLMEQGNYEDAMALGYDALKNSSNNLFFLIGMKTLSEKLGRDDEAKKWDEQIIRNKQRSPQTTNTSSLFEAINQNKNTTKFLNNETESYATTTSLQPANSSIQRFIPKILRRWIKHD